MYVLLYIFICQLSSAADSENGRKYRSGVAAAASRLMGSGLRTYCGSDRPSCSQKSGVTSCCMTLPWCRIGDVVCLALNFLERFIILRLADCGETRIIRKMPMKYCRGEKRSDPSFFLHVFDSVPVGGGSPADGSPTSLIGN